MFTAGGTVVAAYPQIGVAIASSTNPTFRANLLADARIQNASATTGLGYMLDTGVAAPGPRPAALPNAPAADTDTLFGLQWDMRQIHTPEAHAITGGSPSILVATSTAGAYGRDDRRRGERRSRLRIHVGGLAPLQRQEQQLLRLRT
jgi:hypothetical protein